MWRTTLLAGGGTGCGSGQPGAASALSARRLDINTGKFASDFPAYPIKQPSTVLPLGKMIGLDMRAVYPFPTVYGADPGTTLSQAATQGLYRVSWSGDATSLLIAFQMPTTPDGKEWDMRARGGRITPDLAELEGVPSNPPYGKFLEFGWKNTLAANQAKDHFGQHSPLTLAGLTASPICKDFSGNKILPFGSLNYGDVARRYYHTIADSYGYFRQYDYGSCSAFLPMRTFLNVGLNNAAQTQTVTVPLLLGATLTLHIHTTSVRILMASVLRDQPLQGPALQAQPVLRSPGTDELQADLDARGHVDTTVLGGGISCPFHATWKVRLQMDVDPASPYYNRLQLFPSDIAAPHIDLGNCKIPGVGNEILDAYVIQFNTLGRESYQKIAEGAAKNASGTVKSNLMDQLRSDVYAANEALTPPIPERTVLALGPALGRDALDQEIRTHRATSTLLLSNAPGPGHSCISGDLQRLDNGECTFQSDPTLQSLLRHPQTAILGRALRRLMRSNPSMFTCAPIRGPEGYSGSLDAVASQAPYTDPATGRTVSLANHIGACEDPDDVPRLFVIGDTVVQACLNPLSPNPACQHCVKAQDGGTNCNFWNLLAFDNSLPSLVGVTSIDKCLQQVRAPGVGNYPQVVCLPAASAPGARCVPRFNPGFTDNEHSAMCVPVQGLDSPCAPCFDMLDPGYPGAVEHAADRAACLAAPAFCRVQRGDVNPASCDARALASFIDAGLIRIPTPYRCRLELPLSRIDLQPDGYRIVLSNGFACQNGTLTRTGPSTDCRPCPPGGTCPIGSLSQDKLKYLVWDRLTGLLGGNLGLQDIEPPGCYPDREEFGHPARPLTGTSALLGQLQNGKTLINPAGCGWQ